MKLFKRIRRLARDIIFPPLCILCGKYIDENEENPVCADCSDHLVVHRYPERVGTMTIWSAADYRDKNIKKMIRILKYGGIKTASETLGNMLAEHISSIGLTPSESIIVPIPLHPSKERKRGYNQSELIAIVVGRISGIQVVPGVLRRIKKGEPQMSIEDYKERAENIRGAFVSGRDNGEVRGKTMILVDDVLTSGATMREAVKEIRKMKPKRIIPAVVARAK
jgi:ComF family protein